MHVERVLGDREQEEPEDEHENFSDATQVTEQIEEPVRLTLVLDLLRSQEELRAIEQLLVVGVARLSSYGLIELLVDVVEFACPGWTNIDVEVCGLNLIASQVDLINIDLVRA